MADLNFKLELRLKRIAMISIAEAIWKSQEIINKIGEILPKLKLGPGKCRYLGEVDCFIHWRKMVIEFVFKKTSGLFLPLKVITDLQEIIFLTGEKLFYFYDSFRDENEAGKARWEYSRCSKCVAAAGTEHFYSFSMHGTMVVKCPSLHFKNIQNDIDDKKFNELLKDACRYCSVEFIETHKKKIIAYLESRQPGLKLKKSKDVVLSIICAWYLMDPELRWSRLKFEPRNNKLFKLPKKYYHQRSIFSINRKDSNFIVPVEAIPQFCSISHPTAVKYFANKLNSLKDRKPMLFSKMVQVLIGFDHVFMNCRLHYYPAPDNFPGKILYVLNLMSGGEKKEFLEENLNNLMMCFLPVWPYVEKVPEILDFCIEKNFELDYKFLLMLIIACIEIHFQFRYNMQEELYTEIFVKIWSRAPVEIKVDVFSKKIDSFRHNPSWSQISKLTSKYEISRWKKAYYIPKEPKATNLYSQWLRLMKYKNFYAFQSFLDDIFISQKWFSDFLDCYFEQKALEIDYVMDYIFVL